MHSLTGITTPFVEARIMPTPHRLRNNAFGFAAVCAALLFPAASFAFGLGSLGGGGGPPLSLGDKVTQGYSTPGGNLATTQNVSNAATWVAATNGHQISQMGQAITANQAKKMAEEKKLNQAQAQNFHNQLKGLESTMNAMKAKDTYLAPGSFTASACGSSQIGSAVQQGEAASSVGKAHISKALMTHATQYTNSGQGQQVNAWLKASKQSISYNSLMPGWDSAIKPQKPQSSGSKASQKPSAATQYSDHLLNPEPAPVLTKYHKKIAKYQKNPGNAPPVIRRYLERHKEYRARIAPDNNIQAELQEWNTANIPIGNWAKAQWESMGDSGNPPGMINNKMSTNSLLNLLVNERYANPSFYNRVNNQDNNTGLLREIALMQSAELKMTAMRLRLAQQNALIKSTRDARQVDSHYYKTLTKTKNAAANYFSNNGNS